MAEGPVVEPLEAERHALLPFPILAQFEKLQFPEGIE